MFFPAFILFSFCFSALVFALVIEKSNKSLGLLFLFSEVVLTCSGLATFGALNQGALLIVALLLLIISACLTYQKRPFLGYKFSGNPWLVLLFVTVSFFAFLLPLSETDSLAYHLPILSNLVATGGIQEVFQAGFVGPNTYFPANHELLQAFFQIAFQSDRFNYVVTFLGLALFCLALQAFTKDKYKGSIFIFVAAAASVPFLFRQLIDFQIDLFLFALFGASLAYLLSSIVNKRHQDLYWFFLCFGIALGTKYNALLQGVFFLPLILWAFWQHRHSFKKVIGSPLLIIPTGSLWYLRNWILTDNPLYPFGIDFGPLHWEGHLRFLMDMGNTSLMNAIAEKGWGAVSSRIFSEPDFSEQVGHFYLLILCAMLLIGLIAAKKTERKNLGMFLFLFTLIFGTFFSYLGSPHTFTLWNETVRYMAVSLAIFPVLLTFSIKLVPRLRYFSLALLVPLLLIQWWQTSFTTDQESLQMISGRVAGKVPETELKDDFLSKKLPGYSKLLPHLQQLRAENSGPGKNRLALAGPTHYALFMKEGYDPVYLQIDGCADCTYPDYRLFPDSVRSHPDQQKWLDLIRAQKVNYLLVGIVSYHNNGLELYEQKWADENPDLFVKLLQENDIALYKIHTAP